MGLGGNQWNWTERCGISGVRRELIEKEGEIWDELSSAGTNEIGRRDMG